ncbi:MAG: hypothetical protein ABSB37_10025 [Xanthobacteraceae bacterium]
MNGAVFMLHVLQNIPVDLQWSALAHGGSMQHTGDMDDDPDPNFFEWAKANNCSHEVMAAALAATEEKVRRSRRLQAEFLRHWIRGCFADEMVTERGKKHLAAAVVADRLNVSKRTVWNAFAPAAPAWSREKFHAAIA